MHSYGKCQFAHRECLRVAVLQQLIRAIEPLGFAHGAAKNARSVPFWDSVKEL